MSAALGQVGFFMTVTQRIQKWLLKSLYDLHPDLVEREHLWRIWSDEEAQNPSTFKTYASDYNITTWVHVAVKKWQDAISSLPLHVVVGSEPVSSHPLNDFFSFPNPKISSSSQWRQWATDQALGGESGFEFTRNRSGSRVLEMWLHQPSVFSVIPDAERRVYYVPAGYKIEYIGVKTYEVPANEFLHTKFYNPQNPWRGISPMSAIRMSVAIEQLSSAWTKMFFTNGARPDGVLITPQGITKKEREEVEAKFQQRLGLTSKGVGWHKVIALEKGIVDYKPVNFTQKDMQWAETRKLSANEILAIFGVPDELGGLGRNTYENFERALLVFWSETIVPLLAFRDSQMTFYFRQQNLLSGEQRIATDVTSVSVLNRLQNPRYQLALWLFQMGVPYNRIDAHLNLGVGDIGAVGDLSFPSGSAQTLSQGGEVVSEQSSSDLSTAEKPVDDTADERAEKILKTLKNRVGANGVLKT